MYIYARDIDLPFSTILVLDFGTVPIVCRFYYVFFLLFILTKNTFPIHKLSYLHSQKIGKTKKIKVFGDK